MDSSKKPGPHLASRDRLLRFTSPDPPPAMFEINHPGRILSVMLNIRYTDPQDFAFSFSGFSG